MRARLSADAKPGPARDHCPVVSDMCPLVSVKGRDCKVGVERQQSRRRHSFEFSGYPAAKYADARKLGCESDGLLEVVGR